VYKQHKRGEISQRNTQPSHVLVELVYAFWPILVPNVEAHVITLFKHKLEKLKVPGVNAVTLLKLEFTRENRFPEFSNVRLQRKLSVLVFQSEFSYSFPCFAEFRISTSLGNFRLMLRAKQIIGEVKITFQISNEKPYVDKVSITFLQVPKIQFEAAAGGFDITGVITAALEIWVTNLIRKKMVFPKEIPIHVKKF